MNRRCVHIFAAFLLALTFSYLSQGTEIVTMSDGTGTWRLEPYITTHFVRTQGDGAVGGEMEDGYYDPHSGRDPDLRWMNREKDGAPFDDALKPAYDNYHGETTVPTAVNIELYGDDYGYVEGRKEFVSNGVADPIDDFQNDVFVATGVHVDILNFDPGAGAENFNLVEKSPNVQILNNVYHHDSLITVIFPPGWSKSPVNKYPILVKGLGYLENTNQKYTGQETKTAEYAAISPQYGAGLIVLEVNCRGRESLGTGAFGLRDVGTFLADVMPYWGGDPDRVVMSGGSRAGQAALVWGFPSGYGYTVRAIHAYVPPLKIGSMLRFSPSTFPSLTVVNEILGSDAAYQYGYAGLSQTEKAQAAARVLLGMDDLSAADRLSAYGIYASATGEILEALQEKRIFLTYGSHDSFMPLPHVLEFDTMLTEKGIPHALNLGYGGFGHGFYHTEDDDVYTLVRLVAGADIEPAQGGRKMFIPEELVNGGTGTRTKGVVRITEDLIRNTILAYRPAYLPADHSASQAAFSVTIPYRAFSGIPMQFLVSGEEGKSWRIWCRPEKGYYAALELEGVFGEPVGSVSGIMEVDYGPEFAIFEMAPYVSKTQRFEWFFEYDGREIPNRFTPFVSPDGVAQKAITEVRTEEGTVTKYWHPAGRYSEVNNGVDQFHPLLLSSNLDPVMNGQDVAVKAGKTAVVRLKAEDPDGDEVVYDVVDADGRRISNASLNGITGTFSWQTSAADVGSHVLTALAKDGKGGVGGAEFTIRVTQ